MNCDYVFDVLTRGPFPSGALEDAVVERHLAACHDCRQMAEALRPAVSLFHEELTAGESMTLPNYRGLFCGAESVCTATAFPFAAEFESSLSAQPASWPDGPPHARRLLAGWWHFAAAGIIAIAFGAALWVWGSGQRAASRDGSVALNSRLAYQPDERGKSLLVSLNLPASCWPAKLATLARNASGESETPTSATKETYRCCTQCHSSGNEKSPPIEAIATLTGSCHICHDR